MVKDDEFVLPVAPILQQKLLLSQPGRACQKADVLNQESHLVAPRLGPMIGLAGVAVHPGSIDLSGSGQAQHSTGGSRHGTQQEPHQQLASLLLYCSNYTWYQATGMWAIPPSQRRRKSKHT